MDVPSIISMVGWFVQVTFDKFLSSKLESWASNSGLHHHVGGLKLQLLTIRTLLGTLEGRRVKNEGLAQLLGELRDAAHDAEDLLDELDYYRLQDSAESSTSNQVSPSSSSPFRDAVLAANQTGEFLVQRVNSALDVLAGSLVQYPENAEYSKSATRKNTDRNEIGFRIKYVVDSLARICAAVKDVLGLENLAAIAGRQNPAKNGPRQTSSFLTVSKVYGREKERDHLIELLTLSSRRDNGGIDVIAIVGHGGVGKTTLAQLAYNHTRIVQQFDLRMWVCVSDDFDEVRITREMLEHTCNDRYDSIKSLNKLQEILRSELLSRRFLLVLDDVWDDVAGVKWELLLSPLANMPGEGNKILVTTRTAKTADMVSTIKPVHVDGLLDEDFWPLFQAYVFGDENNNRYPVLRKIGKEIAKKLNGHPLGAKTVGRLLNGNLDEEHWMRVLESNEWNLAKDQNDVIPVLRLSYQRLPGHLRRCLAFCSLFPKGYPFNEEYLIYVWMAQSFLHSQDDFRRLEDIGKYYLHELSQRSFFHMLMSGSSGHFIMSDLLHDLARNVSVDECLAIDGFKTVNIVPTVRHLSIITDYDFGLTESAQISYDEELVTNISKLSSIQETKRIRTMILIGGCGTLVGQALLNALPKLNNIRLLDLSYNSFPSDKLLSVIASLIHLRHLGLRGSNISALPESLCKLYNLQVLDIRDCYQIKCLPDGIINLVNMRHIITQIDLLSKVAGIGKLTCLQELENFYVKKQNGYDIGQLKDMRELQGQLSVRNLENVENKKQASNARLKDKKRLNNLSLFWDDSVLSNTDFALDTSAEVLEALQPHCNLKCLHIVNYIGVSPPKWLIENQQIRNLQSIYFTGCQNWESFPPLNQLPSLRVLHMINMQAIKLVDCGNFPFTIEELWFQDMREFIKWSGSNSDHFFPNLHRLKILNCPELSILPPAKWSGVGGSQLFPCLLNLEIMDCPKLLGLSPLSSAAQFTNLRVERVGTISVIKLCMISGMMSSSFELEIEHCPEIRTLEEEMLQHDLVRRLGKVKIIDCEELVSLPAEGTFISLAELTIKDCPKLKGTLPMVSTLTELSVQKDRLFGYSDDQKISHIENCPSLTFLGEGLLRHHHLTALKSLCIIGLEELVCLPAEELERLVSLQALVIQDCPKFRVMGILPPKLTNLRLQCVGLEALPVLGGKFHCGLSLGRNESSIGLFPSASLSVVTLAFCPELTSLRGGLFQEMNHLRTLGKLAIVHCQNLVYLPPEGFQHLVSLKLLVIHSCPKLMASMLANIEGKLLPASLEQLDLTCFSASYMPLTNLLASLTSLYFLKMTSILQLNLLVLPPLAALQHLVIEDCEELIELNGLQFLSCVEELQIEGCPQIKSLTLSSLKGLQHLNIKQCDELASVEGILSLPNLKSLHVERCAQVTAASDSSSEGLPLLETLYIENTSILTLELLKSLSSLRVLEICGSSGMASQATFMNEEQKQGFQHLTALQKLYLFNCPDLDSLPEDICSLLYLRELYMHGCAGIRSLPERQLPNSLEELRVVDCSEELRALCLEGSADWHKISHIADIRIS